MPRHAIVQSGKVVNVVEWDGESDWAPGNGFRIVSLPADAVAGPGWSYGGGAFNAPPAAPAAAAPDASGGLVEALQRATTVAALKAALLEHFSGGHPTGP